MAFFVCWMMNYISCFIFALQIASCYSVLLSFKNVNIIENKVINEPIYLQGDESVASYASICFYVNGKQCQCFNSSESLFVGAKCILSSAYWFSAIAFYDDGTGYSREISTLPVYVGSSVAATIVQQANIGLVTLVLPLSLQDLERAQLLLYSLKKLSHNEVKEFYIIVPDEVADALPHIPSFQQSIKELKFRTKILRETELLQEYLINFPGEDTIWDSHRSTIHRPHWSSQQCAIHGSHCK